MEYYTVEQLLFCLTDFKKLEIWSSQENYFMETTPKHVFT